MQTCQHLSLSEAFKIYDLLVIQETPENYTVLFFSKNNAEIKSTCQIFTVHAWSWYITDFHMLLVAVFPVCWLDLGEFWPIKSQYLVFFAAYFFKHWFRICRRKLPSSYGSYIRSYWLLVFFVLYMKFSIVLLICTV